VGRSVKKGKRVRNRPYRRVGKRIEFFAELGRDPFTRKRRRRSKTVDTIEEGYAWKKRIEGKAADGIVINDRETLGEWLVRWIRTSPKPRRQSTKRNLESLMKAHIAPAPITSVRLRDLTPDHLAMFFATLPESGSVKRKVWNLLHAALDEAEDRELIARNPAKKSLRANYERRRTVLWWTEWEAATLIRAAQAAEPIRPARGRGFGFSGLTPLIRLVLASGLREGEVCGLEWDAVNREKGTIAVRQQLNGSPLHLTPYLKSDRDDDDVDIDPEVMEVLWAWRKVQTEERLRAGSSWIAEHHLAAEARPNNFVFTCTDGRPLQPATLLKWFRSLVQSTGLPWRRFHGLRHTHAFVLLNNGWSIEKVSRRLGHSSTVVTDQYYGHIVRSRRPSAEILSFTEAIDAEIARREAQDGGSTAGAEG